MSPTEVSDRIEIDDLLTRYATAVDTRDWTLYESCFTTDAVIDYTASGGIKGALADVRRWLSEVMPVFAVTQHLVTNRSVALDGHTASSRSYFFNPLGLPDGRGGMTMYFDGGFYNDKLVRTEHGWRIAERVEEAAYSTRLNRLGVDGLRRRRA
jgi:3-phenylpropionate/cinnamic acid dioxygenase small subunit